MSSRIWEKEEIDFIIQNTSMSIIELAKKLIGLKYLLNVN